MILHHSSSSSRSINEQSATLPLWNSIEYGQSHPDWKDFLTGLKSATVYEQVVNDFLSWQHNINDSITDLAIYLKQYFQFLRDLKKEDGTARYAPNRFRPLASMFMRFWTFSGNYLICLLIKASFHLNILTL